MQHYYRYHKVIPRANTPFLLFLGLLFIAGLSIHQPLHSHAGTTAGDSVSHLSKQQDSISEPPNLNLVSISQKKPGLSLPLFLLIAEEESSSTDKKRNQEFPADDSTNNTVGQGKNSVTVSASLIPPSVKHQIIRQLLTVRMLH